MSKGGSTTSEVKVPEYIEAAAQRNLNRADKVSQLGYVPEYGPTVAAFTPMQQSAFQNTADTASAFGMSSPTSQSDIMGGMGAPTTYAGGVQGYSSAPLYEQMVGELERNRPGQKSYIDSFFIDPMSGDYASQPPVDYTQYSTMAEDARDAGEADRANDLAIAQAQAGAGPQSVYNFTPQTDVAVGGTTVGGTNVGVGGQSTQYYNPDINYEDATTSPLTNEKLGVLQPNSDAVDAMAKEYGVDPNFYNDPNNPIYSSSDFPLGSSLSGTDYTGYSSVKNTGSNTASNDFGSTVQTGYGVGQVDPALAAAAGYTAPSKSGGYTSIADMFDGGGPGASGDTFGGALGGVSNAVGATPTGSKSKSKSKSSSKKGCVVATHAVESGAFTPHMKREAVVWCMDVLHGKWWGEAVRRGYRHCGNKKIAQGKAREHYGEFRRYIDFASGKKRTLRGALTFTLRTVQFFAVGLVKRDA